MEANHYASQYLEILDLINKKGINIMKINIDRIEATYNYEMASDINRAAKLSIEASCPTAVGYAIMHSAGQYDEADITFNSSETSAIKAPTAVIKSLLSSLDKEETLQSEKPSDKPEIKNIYYSTKPGKENVVVIFEDNTKVVYPMIGAGAEFDLNIGVALAVMSRYYGSKTRYHKIVAKKAEDSNEKR